MNFLLMIVAAIAIGLATGMGMAEPTIPTPQDAQLQLQTTVTKTANFNGAGLDLGSGFAPGGLGQPVAAVVNVTSIDTTSANETYTFALEESADNSTFTAVASKAATAVGGVLLKGFVTQRYVRLTLTVAGTTPSITYQAFLNPRAVS